MTRHRAAKGFTIVELLIVIVVIGILASISLVTYGGIQQRATNTARIADARKMKSLIEQYIAINGANSLSSIVPIGWVSWCLGEGYTDVVPGSDEGCYLYQDTYDNTPYPVTSLSALDSALQELGNYSVTALPSIDFEYVWTSGGNPYNATESYSAPYIMRYSPSWNYVIDGKPMYIRLGYALQGEDADCGLRPVFRYSHHIGGQANYTAAGYMNSGSSNNVTYCDIHIPAV